MNLESLVDEITELVLHQLGRISVSATGGRSASAGTLVVMGDGELGGELVSALVRAAAATGGRVTLVPSLSWPRARLEPLVTPDGLVALVDPPPVWGALIADCRAVVVPNLSVSELAALTLLLRLTPAGGAMLAGLIEGRPVLAGADEITRLTVNAARLPKALVEGVRGYVARAAAMGLRLVEGGRLADALGTSEVLSPASASEGRGRNVLTRDDVETMLAGGATTIEVAAGTIVTPLALEHARAAGAEIVAR